MDIYTINWKGPIPFSGFIKENENDDSFKDLMKNGLYLFCLKRKNGSYAVTYVGAAPSSTIFNRVSNWYKLTIKKQSGMYVDFNLDDENNELLDIYLTDIENIDNLIEKNEEFEIFYAVIENKKHAFVKDVARPIFELEGSIKNILRKHMDSRKYLLSLEPPKYRLDFKNIINRVEENQIIIGLND